jgi:hypothetical protein
MRKLAHPIASFVVAVLVVIGIGVGVSASTWNQQPQFNNKVAHFDSQYVRFDYPSDWSAKTYQDISSFSDAIVFLSNRVMHVPCVRHKNAVESGVTCHAPLSRLGYNGVYVEWSVNGFPNWTLANQPGQPISVSGRPARESVISGPDCMGISDAQQDINVVIAGVNNYYAMVACLSGPDLSREHSEVQAMLASAKILQP